MGISFPVTLLSVFPKLSAEFFTSGNIPFGIFNFCKISLSHLLLLILNNMVLLALVASVKCCLPLVNFQIKKVSTVPNNKLLVFSNFFETLTLSKIHFILVAEK